LDVPAIGEILITQSGKKWVVLPRGNGLFVLDDNDTPENFADDIYKQIIVTDADGELFSYIYCLAEDLDEISGWVLTTDH